MAKRTFTLTNAEEQALRAAYDSCADGAERTRLQAVRLYGTGRSVADIVDITQCSRRSLARWCQDYRRAGRESLTDQRSGGNRALLTAEQLTDISGKLQQYTPQALFGATHQSAGDGTYWSVADLRRAVERWTGVTYQQPASYHALFRQCGFSYQRTERYYRSRKEADVVAFQEQVEKN